jgi:serine/threonine-protein kinase HipA
MNEVKLIEVSMNGVKVGRIALTPDMLCVFEYDPAYITSEKSVSPFHLPLKSEIFMAKRTPFNGGFGVERFDRTPGGKIHTVSAAGLLNADYRIPCLDYLDLLKLCHILTKNMEEVEALFRLMAFNVAIKNRDDHAKNFSFQLMDGEWKLSPAYDLLPSGGFNGFHTTTVNNSGEPTIDDMLTVAEKMGLNKHRTREIIQEITELILCIKLV